MPRPRFTASTNQEKAFGRQLRKVSRVVGGIIQNHLDGDKIIDEEGMNKALRLYSKLLTPWAERITDKVVKSVAFTNEQDWKKASKEVGKNLTHEALNSPITPILRDIQARQVQYIRTLPLDAAERVQKLATEAMLGGRRPAEIAQELERSEEVNGVRATLIARTEIARANAALTQARAEYIGATHYIWRTMEDEDVRETHREVANKVFEFLNPPDIPGEGPHGPGDIWNCRCYAEPIIPGDTEYLSLLGEEENEEYHNLERL